MSDKEKSHDIFCPEKHYSKEMCKFCELITSVRNDSRVLTQNQLHDSWMEGYEKGYGNAMRDIRISRGEI